MGTPKILANIWKGRYDVLLLVLHQICFNGVMYF